MTTVELFNWTGFFKPVEGTDIGTVYNKAKAGSAIPLKFFWKTDSKWAASAASL